MNAFNDAFLAWMSAVLSYMIYALQSSAKNFIVTFGSEKEFARSAKYILNSKGESMHFAG
jgi:hypothetical protein